MENTGGCREEINGEPDNRENCGDYVPDTPADPNIQYSVDSDCRFTLYIYEDGTELRYLPDTRNYMAYTKASCMNNFSAGQTSKMLTTIQSHPDLLLTMVQATILTNKYLNDDDSNLGGTLNLYSYDFPDETRLNVESGSEYIPVTLYGWYNSLTNSIKIGQYKFINWFKESEYYKIYSDGYFMLGDHMYHGVNAYFEGHEDIELTSKDAISNQELGVNYDFHDPWYIENPTAPSTDWIQPNEFHPLSEQGDGQGTVQVFLDQGQINNPNSDDPIYRLKAPEFYANQSGIYEFDNWVGAGVAFDPDGSTSSEDLTTPVIFLSSHTGAYEVRAEYTQINTLTDYALTLSSDKSLTIPAGAEIDLNPGFKIEITDNGQLIMEGTETDPIVLKAELPEPDADLDIHGWAGIEINGNATADIQFSYVKFENARIAINVAAPTSEADERDIRVNKCLFINCGKSIHNVLAVDDLHDPEINWIITNNTIIPPSIIHNPAIVFGITDYDPVIKNNIFYGGDIALESDRQGWNGADVDYNIFYQTNFTDRVPSSADNSNENPLFVDPNGGDYHLQYNSPCIDNGDPSSPPDPDGTQADIGAYYYPHLNGTISQDIALSGTVDVQDDFTLEDATMTVAPGTQFVVAAAARMRINGRLEVNGTANDPVVFQSADPQAKWEGLYIISGEIDFNYGIVKQSSMVGLGIGTGVEGQIINSRFEDNHVGLRLGSAANNFLVQNNTITENVVGLNLINSIAKVYNNTITVNDVTGLALIGGSNAFFQGNDISENGLNGDQLHNGGVVVYASSPTFTYKIPVNSVPYDWPTNNHIHNNNGKGIYVARVSEPNLGLHFADNEFIYGGFNHIHDNSGYAVYRATYDPLEPELPDTDPQILAQVNYWRSNQADSSIAATDFFGPVTYYPTAPDVVNLDGDDGDTDPPSPRLLGAISLEQQTLFDEAISEYEAFLAEDPPSKAEALMAMAGIDRCKVRLEQEQEWIAELEAIANAVGETEDVKMLAKNYLVWLYKRYEMPDQAIAELNDLIQMCGDTELEEYYTFELALLMDETGGGLLMKTTPEAQAVQVAAESARDRLLSEMKHTEAAKLYRLLKGVGSGNQDNLSTPMEYSLRPNYPNPFNPITTLEFDLPEMSRVSLVVYDLLGREVVKLVDRELSAGTHQQIWNGANSQGSPVATGVYICRISARSTTSERSFSQSHKMVLLK